ncbi:uncharacterized protein BDZ99DRAFT_525448 [Mytilinidion resinicola]|uniref:Uncharacterized protein n=1 Tax=Mytilinidion resinicola TaxID=574789 RepID=A0A6A6Y9W5_9PEZI|nr:uncharacterized protein BDZ99DRAFT_525448 [Mytilinidion resinicola]KAF2804617.1 hypothetical protein BDZ99DRAFT_525448 [Mytilinidion resinicola]
MAGHQPPPIPITTITLTSAAEMDVLRAFVARVEAINDVLGAARDRVLPEDGTVVSREEVRAEMPKLLGAAREMDPQAPSEGTDGATVAEYNLEIEQLEEDNIRDLEQQIHDLKQEIEARERSIAKLSFLRDCDRDAIPKANEDVVKAKKAYDTANNLFFEEELKDPYGEKTLVA